MGTLKIAIVLAMPQYVRSDRTRFASCRNESISMETFSLLAPQAEDVMEYQKESVLVFRGNLQLS
jgi:hypothetical protein